jgi:Fe-S cluster biogenesis protein NfuA
VSAVEHGQVAARIEEVRVLMSAHAGGVELIDVSPRGGVRLRFTGMCAGCPYRPLTMEGTIRPALESVPGVTSVQAAGARVSDEALARMRRYLGRTTLPSPGPTSA